jgi:hypothetical protein
MNAKFESILNAMPTRSAWNRAVKAYAYDLLEQMEENGITEPTKADLLNGATNWHEWALGGCGLIYDYSIAERTCSPSELERARGGERMPNSHETWLDVEARAVFQAARYILRAFPVKTECAA